MLKIWTDGSCLGNPGPGGWAFIATDGENVAERSGGAHNTTNNQMELTAVIRALAATRHHNEIEIHTDSQYVKNGISSGYSGVISSKDTRCRNLSGSPPLTRSIVSNAK